MHRSGVAVIQVILLLLLMAGLIAISFWAGTNADNWPSGPTEDDVSRLPVYGYVQVEPRRISQLIQTAQNETADYTGLAIEQRTQAGLLATRALLMQWVLESRALLGLPPIEVASIRGDGDNEKT